MALTRALARRLGALSNARLILVAGSVLFALAAWPLLLVDLPPLQDLPNHVATAHIVAHPDLYPDIAFNGFFKSNALLTLWFHLTGGFGLFGSARAFVALVLAVTALALPLFVVHFRGRRHLAVALLFAWPLVHGFSLSMGFLNFAVAFALSLVLATVIDQHARRPTVARGLGVAALAGLVWYAHPLPLAVVVGLAVLRVGRHRARAAGVVLLPLAPAALLVVLAAQRHLVKAPHAPPLVAGAAVFSYLNPWELVAHLWTDVSGAFTPWGSMTIVPALLLPWWVWRSRRAGDRTGALTMFSSRAMILLALGYLALPVMLSNWWCLNCRLVPFLWAGMLLRLPRRLPRPVITVLGACALAYAAVTGIDYLRLDRDRAQFTAGIGAVPERATLLPLLFQHRKTSTFTASLSHAWGYYTTQKDTSAPLVFAVERSYPITYQAFPPQALVPPALDRFAQLRATPAQVCKSLGRPTANGTVDDSCTAIWRELWNGFWREAEPRFSHVLTWAMPPEARQMIPGRYRRTFAAGELEIFERTDWVSVSAPGPVSPYR